ncbi:glycosyltransferase family 2 protein [Sphingomonas jatrophae]|uniref:Beta-monoglucosyldiacylglycerol synthase n=1 Tax=Sphingomonas jatrophae TaxID=1166337 RepID=A0A1I6K6Z3_9SPHN|nr:glycosyltransferase [Sphingomonas jatrophae]SFR86966.1 Glycosyltransferase, catalytic subunit of cellulose synthase and poly-beta-1,6-N-acetylglucosamine synthase [Sphingomonas jatrophae]
MLSREFLDAGIAYAAWLALIAAILTAGTVRRAFSVEQLPWPEAAQLAGSAVLAGLLAYLSTAQGDGAVLATAAGLFAILSIRVAFACLTVAGVLRLAVLPLAAVMGWAWSYALLVEHGAPGWMLTLSIVLGVGVLPLLVAKFAETLAREAMTLTTRWRRPTMPLPRHVGRQPKVSIHLCAYAEPPEIVIAVLDRLNRLDYANFEVLVCDNNTPDEALWRPVEQHCAMLNRALGSQRFRFFHVSPLAGAKAGALNWLLDRTAPDAELIGVIDADYLSEPDFLARLAGFFDDPKLAYIQTPHDYRNWQGSSFLTACYWEYMPSNKVELPGVADVGAGYTIGTMCLIRRSMLEKAGRWAEWCLTEDSEVSVRLRAVGGTGLYLRETFGRGLIPETFDDYKKQRFRWTAGPVQQLRRHWRLYTPRMLGGSTAMDGWSKLLEVMRGIAPLSQVVGMALGIVGLIAALALIRSGVVQPMQLPTIAWIAAAIGTCAALVATWTRYRLAGCATLREMAYGELARLSLSYVQMVGGIAGVSRKPLAWRRTPKFKAEGSGLRALGSTIPETALGFGHLLVAGALAGMDGGDLATVGVIASVASSARFFAAPAMALISERHLAATAPSDTMVSVTA